MSENIEREKFETDVLIVGAGPSGLSAAIKIKQLAQKNNKDISVTIIEKSAEIGSHIISGAIIDPIMLDELIPDWQKMGFDLGARVKSDNFYFLFEKFALKIANFLLPPQMKRKNCYIISLGKLCKFLADYASELGVEIYPATAGADYKLNKNGALSAIITGDMGIGKNGEPNEDFMAGIEFHAKYILISEGARGSLAKRIIKEFELDKNCSKQKYALGIKEIYQVPKEVHQEGLVEHFIGFPLAKRANGGGFLYHAQNQQIYLGLITHLDYKNPTLSPYDEFLRFKSHPKIHDIIKNSKPISYGARAISVGGWQSIPQLSFKGGAIIGCSAGFMNAPAIKAIHLAMKSGIICAQEIVKALNEGRQNDLLKDLQSNIEKSIIAKELKPVRNAKPLWSKFGSILGALIAYFDLWFVAIFKFSLFGTQKHRQEDFQATKKLAQMKKLKYKRAIIEKNSAIDLANISFNEDQPNNLKLIDKNAPIKEILPEYGRILELFCPAGTYEFIEKNGQMSLQINYANCLHCKTCDIKDPKQNIIWSVPEGGSGPNYSSM